MLCNEEELLYTETDASGVGLGSGLVQVQNSTNSSTCKTPENTILSQIYLWEKTYPVLNPIIAATNVKH